MIRIHEIKLNLHQSKEEIPACILKKLRIKKEELISYHIFKESIDARKKDMIYFNYCVDCLVKNEENVLQYSSSHYQKTPDFHYHTPSHGKHVLKHRPIVVGFGPAGMLAALLLAQEGYCPIVYERGACVEERVLKVEEFWHKGILDETTNVQFGEGGAGTFSDGKLTTRVKDVRSYKVLEEFVKYGAPEEILYEANPHIGTDRLRSLVKNIREAILAFGGEIHFEHQVNDFQIQNNRISALCVHDEWIACEHVILAIGHSARDTFKSLYQSKVNMSAKAFAVGVRIEHEQQFINQQQYGQFFNHPRLPVASYRFAHTANNGRGVYTFCMCPGGVVVPSSSSHGKLVVNGMSEYARDQKYANSAILVQVTPDDFEHHPLAGIHYQEALEAKAYELGGRTWKAPVQKVEDYVLHQKGTLDSSINPSYAIGGVACNLHDIFPSYVNQALEEGILAFDRKMKGFSKNAMLTAVETRSSSPLRINRDKESLEALDIQGFYPCGEGAGYAGGIISAAIDGLRCAEKIIEQYQSIRD